MKVLIGLLALGALVGIGQDVASRPNFSGVWVEDARPIPPPGSTPYCPGKCTITHSTEQLVFEWVLKMGSKDMPFKKVIDLVKPDVTVSAPPSGGGATERATRAEWQGNTLVITTVTKVVSQSTAGAGLTTTLKLTLRDNKLILFGTTVDPGNVSPVPFEVVHRKEK